MYIYNKTELKHNFIRFSALRLQSCSDTELSLHRPGTPKCWDELLENTFDFSEYKKYFICHRTLHINECNRITDYKRVWGMMHIEPGKYDNSYNVGEEKIYFGIKVAENCSSEVSNVILYVRNKLGSREYEQIYNLLSKNKMDFERGKYSDGFSNIAQSFSDAYLLHYSVNNSLVYMDIYGKISERLVDNSLINSFDENSAPVYRRSLAFWD